MSEPKTLLVSIMFVTILTLGIANILSSLAEAVTRAPKVKDRSFHIGWILLLLLVHFDLFWQTAAILGMNDWTFVAFLYVVSGPITLFLATHLLLKEAALATTDEQPVANVVSRGFFLLLAVLQLWAAGGDLFFDGGLPPGAGINAALLLLMIVLSVSRTPRVHTAGLVAAWLLFIALLTLLGLEIVH